MKWDKQPNESILTLEHLLRDQGAKKLFQMRSSIDDEIFINDLEEIENLLYDISNQMREHAHTANCDEKEWNFAR